MGIKFLFVFYGALLGLVFTTGNVVNTSPGSAPSNTQQVTVHFNRDG